jgi:hypothetical protein
MRRLRWAGLLLVPSLLGSSAHAAGQQPNGVERTAAPVGTLATDGSRVAYESGGKIHVWNMATGAISVIRARTAPPRRWRSPAFARAASSTR